MDARSPLTVAGPCGICTQLPSTAWNASVVSGIVAWQNDAAWVVGGIGVER